MTESTPDRTARFAVVVAAVFLVAGTIALPDVWLRDGLSPPAPEGLFDGGDPQVDEWVCLADRCFFTHDSLVTQRQGRDRSVAWVINTDNPLTELPVTESGRPEDVRIAAVRARADTLYLQLESGRVVTRTRDGTWSPGVSEFRDVMATALVLAMFTAAAVVAVGWVRSRRVDAALLAAAGVAAAVVHLPVTVWRYTTSVSLSSAGVLSLVLIAASVAAGFLIAGPRHSDVNRRYIPGI